MTAPLDDLTTIPWKTTRHPGVYLHDLTPEGAAHTATLVRMDAGCSYPAHRHVGREEVYVLRGRYLAGDDAVVAPGSAIYPAGSAHHPRAGEDEPCVLLALLHGGGIELLDAETPGSVPAR